MTAGLAAFVAICLVLGACARAPAGRTNSILIAIGGMIAAPLMCLAVELLRMMPASGALTPNQAVGNAFAWGGICFIAVPILVLIARRKKRAADSPALSRH